MKWADLKVFVRSLLRNKLYSAITIFGFSIALSFVILLSVYIRQELAVDGFQENRERVFRLANEKGYGTSGPVGPMLREKFPEVEAFSRFMSTEGVGQVSTKEPFRFTYAFVDPAFFTIFSFPLVEGLPDEVLRERLSMVVSRSLSRKLFGNESPLGKEITVSGNVKAVVTGVMEDIPDDTHFAGFDAAVNIAGLSDYWGFENVLEQWGISTFQLYLMGTQGSDLTSLTGQILAEFKANYPLYQKENAPKKLVVEPLEEIYFSPYPNSGRHNSRMLVGVLVAIVCVILLLAVINYINLSVAQGGFRAKEMSVKKLLGSSRRQLFGQFIAESVILCMAAAVVACFMSGLLEPIFNQLMNTHIRIIDFFSPVMVIRGLGVIVLIGVVSGLVPAMLITRFSAVEVVKGSFRKRTKGVYSKVLICFQYTVAILLTICTLVLVKQTHYMRTYDLGFNKENIARFSYVLDAEKKETLRNEVLKLAGVKEVAFVTGDPVDGGNNYTFQNEERTLSFQSMTVDSSFFRMLELKVTPTGGTEVEGRTYLHWSMKNGKTTSAELREQSVWLNEEAVRQLDVGDLPKEFKVNGRMQQVRGVVNNFHIRELSQRMDPVMIQLIQKPETPWTMLVQLQGENQGATFHAVEQAYKELSGGVPFDSGFMDTEIAAWYDRTERISAMIGNLCLLAVILSAMGILAMATYFIQQRVKEIGIRRVNGATVREVLEMLMNGFMKWIVVAFVIACPLGYYAMERWLSDFAYRTSIDWWVFVVSGGLALLVAGMMICWQSWRAATANPVEALKSE